MKIIEFFGPPCSGKTSNANFLIIKNRNFISSNNLIFKYSNEFLKLTILDRAVLNYMSAIKYLKQFRPSNHKNIKKISKIKKKINNGSITKNTYTNLIISRYRSICHRLYNLYFKKNSKFIKFYLKNLNKIKDREVKNNYRIWFEETAAKYYIAKNPKKKKIAIFDEGFIQRSYILNYQNNNFRNKLDIYLSLMDQPDYAVYLDTNAKNLIYRSNLRKKHEKNIFVYKNLKEINKFKFFFKYVLKKLI